MTFVGSWRQVRGQTGKAVRFTAAPSFGVARGSSGQNPDGDPFAFRTVFRSRMIPSDYSGNLMQKGLYDDAGQVKLQLVPANHGSVSCRLKGAAGVRVIGSGVEVDDGDWHTATCWRTTKRVGLTVDGSTRSMRWDPGAIASDRAVHIGNKSRTADYTDQVFGAVDCSVYTWGTGARARAQRLTPC